MASAKNIVLAGDYIGCRVFRMSASLAYISGTMKKMDDIFLVPEKVKSFEVMTEEILRSGNSLLLTGSLDPGLLVKLKLRASEAYQNKGIYTVVVKLEDDTRALMEIDDKIYAAIVRRLQNNG